MMIYVFRLLLSAGFIACFLLAPVAHAQSAEDLKRAGVAGEKPDGYLGVVVPNASSSVKASVADINGKRRAHYNTLAKKNGTSVSVVESLFCEKLIKRAGSGEYIMNAAGKWIRK